MAIASQFGFGAKVFGARNKILPRVRLGCLKAAAIPGFSLLAAAANMGNGEHHAMQDEIVIANAEGGVKADAIGAVARKNATV